MKPGSGIYAGGGTARWRVRRVKNMKNNWAVAICAVLAIISVGSAISTTFIKPKFISVDLMAALVGVLSLLVTVLAVFLALNYLMLENRIKREVQEEITRIKSDMEKQMNDINCAVQAYFTYANSGDFIVSSLHGRLIGCLDGLKIESKSQKKHAVDTILKEFMDLIPNLSEEESYLPIGTKSEYLSFIKKMDDPRADEIYKFVLQLPERTAPEN